MSGKAAKKLSHGLSVKFHGVEWKEVDGVKKGMYILKVTMGGEGWDLSKRYSDFFFFQQNLDKKIYGSMSSPFPPKLMGTLTAEQMDTRMEQLKAWFAEFLAMPITPRVLAQLNSFLRVIENTKQAGSLADVRKFPGMIIKTGYLSKLGGNKAGGAGNWKRRYCVLTDDLVYYETEEIYQNGGAAKGKVSMNCIYCPNPDETDEHEFTIYAIPYEFTVRAETHEEMMDWVKTFQKIQTLN